MKDGTRGSVSRRAQEDDRSVREKREPRDSIGRRGAGQKTPISLGKKCHFIALPYNSLIDLGFYVAKR
jgi:hypothetical protein